MAKIIKTFPRRKDGMELAIFVGFAVLMTAVAVKVR